MLETSLSEGLYRWIGELNFVKEIGIYIFFGSSKSKCFSTSGENIFLEPLFDLNIGEDLNEDVIISGRPLVIPRLIFYGIKSLNALFFIYLYFYLLCYYEELYLLPFTFI